jgi:chromosome partitioning protein
MVISVAIQKGGSGKTTTAINLAAALRELGRKVLLIDLDPQANLTQALKIAVADDKDVYAQLKLEADGDAKGWEGYIYESNGMAVVPASLALADAELELVSVYGREHLLDNLLRPLRPEYDYIVVDCPPAIGILTVNALVASDYVLIPLQAEFLPLKGVRSFKKRYDKIREKLNKKLDILGLLITRYDQRLGMSHDIVAELEKEPEIGPKLFKTKIRTNIALAKAQQQGTDIFTFDKNANGAMNYAALAFEIEGRINNPGK